MFPLSLTEFSNIIVTLSIPLSLFPSPHKGLPALNRGLIYDGLPVLFVLSFGLTMNPIVVPEPLSSKLPYVRSEETSYTPPITQLSPLCRREKIFSNMTNEFPRQSSLPEFLSLVKSLGI